MAQRVKDLALSLQWHGSLEGPSQGLTWVMWLYQHESCGQGPALLSPARSASHAFPGAKGKLSNVWELTGEEWQGSRTDSQHPMGCQTLSQGSPGRYRPQSQPASHRRTLCLGNCSLISGATSKPVYPSPQWDIVFVILVLKHLPIAWRETLSRSSKKKGGGRKKEKREERKRKKENSQSPQSKNDHMEPSLCMD